MIKRLRQRVFDYGTHVPCRGVVNALPTRQEVDRLLGRACPEVEKVVCNTCEARCRREECPYYVYTPVSTGN